MAAGPGPAGCNGCPAATVAAAACLCRSSRPCGWSLDRTIGADPDARPQIGIPARRPLYPDVGILVRRGQRLPRQAHGPHLKRGVFRFVIDLQVAIHSETNLNPKSFVSTTDPKCVRAPVEGGCERQRVSSLAWPRQTKLPLSKAKVSPPPIAGIRRRPARTFC
jgi:hypothetical protein